MRLGYCAVTRRMVASINPGDQAMTNLVHPRQFDRLRAESNMPYRKLGSEIRITSSPDSRPHFPARGVIHRLINGPSKPFIISLLNGLFFVRIPVENL